MGAFNSKEVFKDYYNEYLEDFKTLLKCPSVLDKFDPKRVDAPFGYGVRLALDKMLEIGSRMGFKCTNVDNYCGFMDYGDGDEMLIILAHLDVVPATGAWSHDPFDPVIKNNRIYARGTSDDKGPLLSCLYALKMLKDEGFVPNKKIRFFVGCDEESGSRCLEHYLSKYGQAEYGFSPDALYPLIYAEKGISGIMFKGKSNSNIVSFKCGTVLNIVPDVAEATIKDMNLEKEFKEFLEEFNLRGSREDNTYKLFGKACHGSMPQLGLNAGLYLSHFLSKYISDPFLEFQEKYLFNDFIAEKFGVNHHDIEMGDISNNAGVIKMENGEFSVGCNFRYPKGFDFDKSMEHISELVKEFNISLEVLSNSPVHYVPKDSKLVQDLLNAYKKWVEYAPFSKDTEPLSIGGGTYARDFKNAVAFGALFPGEKDSMHMIDESSDLDNLILSVYIYKDAIKNICE